MMTIGDRQGLIFLSYPHMNNGFFSCSPLNTSFILEKLEKKLPENPEYAEIRHGDVTFTLQLRYGSTCDQREASRFLSFPRADTGV